MEFWPAGLHSPSVYYMLRERQLAYNINAAVSQGPASWRRQSVAKGRACELLQRRGLPPLSVRVPQTLCNIRPGETAVYVRAVQRAAWQQAPKPAVPAAPRMAAAAAAADTAALAQAPLHCQDTPLQLLEQPAKRSRLSTDEHTPRPGHLIARSSAGMAGSARLVAAVPRSAASSRSQSTAGSPCMAGSPLGALFRRMRGMMSSPTPQPAAVSAY
ncbi:hypothetical protein CHLNCDRAFT_136637 [Chlorella variabilis]|uniref:Uncharacterized protein n=1 Tax=Chlorella variabilis TaxID=554065 RepID=E1ZKQ9_CHLVA|nr:hypothetical protein CHLNCDRAFT_136637 [Chlorella variabilis]EFN53532.1 hypothetical protein CHLNCDRAFT_136637 [Chlorella variabilis]|eukprot:XP_005845634.1 hypothetical protein CHLNCDRAFT_136637 [Chlorella variabilis]